MLLDQLLFGLFDFLWFKLFNKTKYSHIAEYNIVFCLHKKNCNYLLNLLDNYNK